MNRHAEPESATNCLACRPGPNRPADWKPRLCERGHVCEPCRSRIANNLTEIRNLHADLANPDPGASEDGWNIVDRKGRTVVGAGHDPVAYEAPAGPIAGQHAGGRVSGSKDAPAPINLTIHDLTAVARRSPDVALTIQGRREWDGEQDQIGDLAVATTLDTWVRLWLVDRDRGEHRPQPSVAALVEWFQVRLEWACDEYGHVGEFADDMFRLRCRLRAVSGLIDVPDYKKGVPCKKCDRLTLLRENGSDWIACTSCPSIMSPDEFEAWTRLLSRADKGDLIAQYAPRLD